MSIALAGVPVTLSLFVLSAGPLAPLADFLLKKKHAAMDRHWQEMLETCAAQETRSGYEARWLRSQRDALASGKLCRERALALEKSGLVKTAGDTSSLTALNDETRSFSYTPSLPQRLGYATACIVCPGIIALSGANIESIILSSIMSLVLTLITICDIRARIIPYQACIAYGALGACWTLMTRGLEDFASSILLALLAGVVLALVERYAIRLTARSAIGAGDRRLIPFIFLAIGFQGLFPGLVALCAIAGPMAVFSLIRGKGMRSYLPFAPALMACAVVGMLWPFLPIP